MGKLPYMEFYVGDWRTDPAVSLCTPATRGVWIDLLTAMHQAGRSGELRGTCEQLARIARCSTADLTQALTELQTTGTADVTERNGVFTIANRRMRREAQEREATRLRQAKFRASQTHNNGEVTPMSPIEGEGEDDKAFFSDELPEILDVRDFRKAIGAWLTYKAERRETYKPAGLTAMVSRAAKLASQYGLPAVIDAMQRAAANLWAGWDQPSLFPVKGPTDGRKRNTDRDGPGQTYRD